MRAAITVPAPPGALAEKLRTLAEAGEPVKNWPPEDPFLLRAIRATSCASPERMFAGSASHEVAGVQG